MQVCLFKLVVVLGQIHERHQHELKQHDVAQTHENVQEVRDAAAAKVGAIFRVGKLDVNLWSFQPTMSLLVVERCSQISLGFRVNVVLNTPFTFFVFIGQSLLDGIKVEESRKNRVVDLKFRSEIYRFFA